MTESKTCRKCKTAKSLDEFHVNRSQKDGRNYYCKGCQNAKSDAWRQANRAVARAAAQRYRHKIRKNLRRWTDSDAYKEAAAAQNGRCPICTATLRHAVVNVDSAGNIHGVFCRRCYTILCLLKKDPEALTKFSPYVTSPPSSGGVSADTGTGELL